MTDRNKLAEPDANLLKLLTYLDSSHVPAEEFGCFVALSEDKATIFTCPMNADGSPDRDSDNPLHMNWTEVSAPEPDFVKKINQMFGTSFRWDRFAGR